MKQQKQTYHEQYNEFYNSAEWKSLRNQKFYNANGLCEMCLLEGVVNEGKEVHHKIFLDNDWSKRLDYRNLILLCPNHHNEMHERISPLQKFLRDWDNM